MRREARIPSKRMPAYIPPQEGRLGCWIMLAVMGGVLVCLCIREPGLLIPMLIIAAVAGVIDLIERRRQRRVAAERTRESICSFARSFNCRAVDTWVVRAVFEEVMIYVKFPVRAADRLEKDLRIDPEDTDILAEAVAQRTGRSLDQCENNPLYGKITTVGELVEFCNHQPRRTGAAA